MSRKRTPAQRREAQKRQVIYLPHQRRLSIEFRTIEHELVDAGEGKVEERAMLIPEFAIGWPRDSQTAQMMEYLESFAFANSVTPFSALPVH